MHFGVVFDYKHLSGSFAMSHSKNGANKPGTRNLPSWMSSRDNESDKKPNGDGEGEGQKPWQGRGRASGNSSGESSSGTTNVSKLLVLDSVECVFIELHCCV